MSEGANILVKGGRPWFSYSILACAVALTITGAGFYFSTKATQAEQDKRLTAREENDKKTSDALGSIAADMRDLHGDVKDLKAALLDRWTGTDMKFTWIKVGTFWSEFRRLNPTVTVPEWPDAKRVNEADGH